MAEKGTPLNRVELDVKEAIGTTTGKGVSHLIKIEDPTYLGFKVDGDEKEEGYGVSVTMRFLSKLNFMSFCINSFPKMS